MTRTMPSKYKTSEDGNIQLQLIQIISNPVCNRNRGVLIAQNLAQPIPAWCHYLYLAGHSNALRWPTTSAAAHLHMLRTVRMSLISGSDVGDFPYPSFPEQLMGSNQLSSSVYQHTTIAAHFLLAHKSQQEKKGSSLCDGCQDRKFVCIPMLHTGSCIEYELGGSHFLDRASWYTCLIMTLLGKYRMGHEKVVRLLFAFAFGYCINFYIYATLWTRATFLWPGSLA